MRWKITIEAWPHSRMDMNADEAQHLAGERSRDYEVEASDMADAFRLAKAIARGVESNPAVWQAPIMAIVRVR